MSDSIDSWDGETLVQPQQHNPSSDILRKIAIAISYLFHPILMSVYIFFFINTCYPFVFAHMGKVVKMQVFMALAVNTIAFPVITVLIMQKLGFANSLQLRTQRERILPYIAMSLFYFWTFMVIRNLAIGELFTHIMLGASISIFMAFFLNNFYKISIHSVGAGNFVAVALVLTMLSNFNLEAELLVAIMMAGVIGSARLYLKAHRSRDIYTGYMIGILAQLIAFQFL
jgi:hypothetical protein